MFHPVLPDIEMNISKQTIVLMIYPHGTIVPYKITPRDEFFVLNEPRAVGVYLINDKYRFMWNGRTPMYIYAVGNFTPIDPVKIDALNKWKKENRLTQVRQKDIRHASMLRHLINRMEKTDAFKMIEKNLETEGQQIAQAVQTAVTGMASEEADRLQRHGQELNRTPEHRALIIINYLKSQGLIDDQEQATLTFKVENNKLSFDELFTELKSRQVVSVAEPIHEELEDFLQDMQQQDENNLATFVQETRSNRRGVKAYKQTLVKQWISSFVLAGSIIGATITPLVIALIGFIHMFDLRMLAIGGIALIIAMGRYHFPLGIAPIALVFYPNATIIPFKLKRGLKSFVLDMLPIRNIYSKNNKLRLMWNGSVPCYLYKAEKSDRVDNIMKIIQPLGKEKRKQERYEITS